MPATQLDHYVTLGNSGLRVSPLCLGAMTFGTEWGIGAEMDDSFKQLDRFYELGGNFIDTANMYNKGESEVILGSYFRGKAGKGQRGVEFPFRDRWVIATKWLGNMYPGDPNGGGASRKALMESVEQSLRRMRTDYIDLLWMHFWDQHTPIEETMRGLDDLVTSGKVRYLGFSDTPAWKCAQAQTTAHFRSWAPLIALQIEYSMIERTVEGELIPMAQELGMGVTPWSPLKGGLLSGKYKKDQMPEQGRMKEDNPLFKEDRTWKILTALEAVSGETGRSMAEVALAWLRAKPGVASIIIGARTIEHLESNLASLTVDLTDEHIETLDEASKPKLNFPHDFLQFVRTPIHNGTTINGVSTERWGASPQNDAERW
ncbi:MAG: aldo/keto reductase [Planctomycetota bacterium]